MSYLRRNPSLPISALLIVSLLGFALIGRVFVPYDVAFPLTGPASMLPDADFPFGTDADGRDLFAMLVYGTLLTLKIGVVAGLLGVAMGTVIAFIAANRGGWID